MRGITAASCGCRHVELSPPGGPRGFELRKQGMACILLWMQGGPSHFETFSPKPHHANGGETKAISTAVPGIEVSEHYPHVAAMMQRPPWSAP